MHLYKTKACLITTPFIDTSYIQFLSILLSFLLSIHLCVNKSYNKVGGYLKGGCLRKIIKFKNLSRPLTRSAIGKEE